MRRFQLAPLVLLLVACGGSAARNAQPAPSEGGAAAEPSLMAGAANVAGAGAGDAGAGGKPGTPPCAGLDCLAGAELLYVPDREWQRNAALSTPFVDLPEAEYTPLLGPTWRVKFSSDALTLELTATAGGDTASGKRDPKRTDRAWFDLKLATGGRFVVQASSNELHAEQTHYGSGVPIVSSTRGLLKSP